MILRYPPELRNIGVSDQRSIALDGAATGVQGILDEDPRLG